jgi:hypothetical protein
VCMRRGGCGTHDIGERVDFEEEGIRLIRKDPEWAIYDPNMDDILLLDSFLYI